MSNFFSLSQKPVIYLHIGMNKTGTSALQSYLKCHQLFFKKQSILYPDTGLIGSTHYALSASLGFHHNTAANKKWKIKLPTLKKLFLAELKQAKPEEVIFSSEDFLLNKPLDPVKQFFHGFEVKVIIYLRRHDHWWLSAYSQAVKMKSNPPWGMGPRAFVEFNRKRNPNYGNYKGIVEKWSNAFGKDNIIIRPYEKIQNQPSLAIDLLKSIGQKLDFDTLPSMNNNDNTSLSVKHVQFMDVFQRLNVPNDVKRHLLDQIKKCKFENTDKLALMLRPQFRRKLIEQNRADYEFLAREYLNRADGRLFYEELPAIDSASNVPTWPTSVETAQMMHDLLAVGSTK